MTDLTLYHNPRCSKSRQTLQLLTDRGLAPEVVRYLETPPDAAELEGLCAALGIEPTGLVRFKEDTARALGLSPRDDRPRAEWLRLLAENPVLIERPIVVVGTRAAIGRPPEAVLPLLD